MKADSVLLGRPAIPLALKLLGALRVLGRASCFDDIAELTHTSEEVILLEARFHSLRKYAGASSVLSQVREILFVREGTSLEP